MNGEFDPSLDGWSFKNWGEEHPYCRGCALPAGHTGACEFPWDNYRDAYLGINPTHDCIEAPPDCAFYEIFKTCAKDGNCGGMSLLALALYKYGGFMGFCSPASFYTGTRPKAPDRDDLHRAINILQARQFSAKGIMNFVETWDANNINDALNAYQRVSEQLAKGDYAVLSIANDYLGDAAHTVIPYKVEDNPPSHPGKKVMHIWDPNHPYDDDPSHYSGTDKLLVIKGRHDWTYTSGSTTYIGADGGWCFAVPMSTVLTKSRQPMALELFAEALITLFTSGPGSAISQISDDEGHRFYTTDADIHTSRLEFETDPELRLKGVVRWPWFFKQKEQSTPGELYFIRREKSNTNPLNFTVSGTEYKVITSLGNNLIEFNSKSRKRTKDIIKTYGPISDAISMDIKSTAKRKQINVDHLLIDKTKKEWRRFKINNMSLLENTPVTIEIENNMKEVKISSKEKKVQFELAIEQRANKKVSINNVGKMSTLPNRIMRIAPKNWKNLEKTEIIKDVIENEKKQRTYKRREK